VALEDVAGDVFVLAENGAASFVAEAPGINDATARDSSIGNWRSSRQFMTRVGTDTFGSFAAGGTCAPHIEAN
jgi:hypothetical protein